MPIGTTSVTSARNTGMSMLMFATSVPSTPGLDAKCSAPSRPRSSAVSATNSSVRLGAGVATSSVAASSITAVPRALSKAPL